MNEMLSSYLRGFSESHQKSRQLVQGISNHLHIELEQDIQSLKDVLNAHLIAYSTQLNVLVSDYCQRRE